MDDFRPLRTGPGEMDQLPGIPYGQIAEHDGVQDAEDRGVRPEPERERQDDGGGEPGALGERAERVAHVLEHGVHHSLLRATIGSTRDARRAGAAIASSETPTRPRGKRTHVTGSPGCTP